MSFKLLSYNIYLRTPLLNARGNDYKEKRLEQMLQYEIDKYDVIIFQELWAAFNFRRSKCIKEAEKKGFRYHESLHRTFFPLYFVDGGVTILSKHPIVETDQIVYSRGCCQDWWSAKGILYTKLKVGDDKFIHLFGTHTQADYKKTWEENKRTRKYRNVQLKECFDFIKKKTKNDDYPILFAGDLNIIGVTRDYDELIELMKNEKYKFQPKDILFDQHNEHPTTFNDMIDGHKVDEVITSVVNETGCPIRLDYVFFLNQENRKELQYKDCVVEKFHSESGSIFPFLSDHYGVEATIIYE